MELFSKEKSELKMSLLKYLKATYSVDVRCLHCGSNVLNGAFKWLCKQEEMGITFKYTMPGTPQKNGQVERKFATLSNVMLNVGKFLIYWEMASELRQLILSCYTKKTINRVKPLSTFFGNGKRSILTSLEIFDEMCIMTSWS